MMFSKLDLRKLIIPLIIEQALAFMVGLVDTIMVAGISEEAVSGVALVDSINILLISFLAALATGGAIVAGQYLGLKEKKHASHAARQLVIAAFTVSVVLMGVCLFLNRQMLSAFFGEVAPDVMNQASVYFYITALSYPFIAMFNVSAALFRSMGNSKTGMLNALVMNILNIAGNALFIYGMRMGVTGAALSTLISRIVAAVIMLYMLRNPALDIHARFSLKGADFPMIRRILRVGIPSGLENSMFQIGKIVVTRLVAIGGTTAIAAHAVSNSLALVEIVPGSAMGLAILSVVARCVGAGEYGQAEYYTKYLMKRAYLYMLLLNGAVLALLQPILGLYQLSDATFALALQLVTLHSISAVLIWPTSFTLPNAFRAAGDVKYPMTISIISMWAFRIVLSCIFVYALGWGVFSIWVAMVIDWGFRSIFFAMRWKSKKWQHFSAV